MQSAHERRDDIIWQQKSKLLALCLSLWHHFAMEQARIWWTQPPHARHIASLDQNPWRSYSRRVCIRRCARSKGCGYIRTKLVSGWWIGAHAVVPINQNRLPWLFCDVPRSEVSGRKQSCCVTVGGKFRMTSCVEHHEGEANVENEPDDSPEQSWVTS